MPISQPTPSAPPLEHNDIHLWMGRLDRRPDELAPMRAMLSRDETERASRFRFEDDRSRFIASRAILRQLLSLSVAYEPESISLEYNPWGKPALAAKFADNDIRFNLSHSHGLAVYAIARGREVGVDVEKVRPDFANGEIAERFFSRTEAESLRSLPLEHQTRAFFVCLDAQGSLHQSAWPWPVHRPRQFRCFPSAGGAAGPSALRRCGALVA
jgi:4'-phosphopantetheinyl transferase